uniref:Macaca fascicularis brain cDNA, clone: QflA-18945 n=1 Tax=Macaca fascicularis TaxID=9541 RepID=I7GCC4_MACFA|nr:unnamed protein product [Macaca fascicularis]
MYPILSPQLDRYSSFLEQSCVHHKCFFCLSCKRHQQILTGSPGPDLAAFGKLCSISWIELFIFLI